jgi:hypothetical protein
MPYFNGPTFNVKRGMDHPLWWTSIDQAKTLVKYGGTWRTVLTPQGDFLKQCDVVLRGGYVIDISNELAAELTAAGYGEFISEG